MIFLWVLFLAILLALQFIVLFRGAPYLPTRHKQREEALDLLALKPGQSLLDLGCGDGAMLIAAARRGLVAVGYEINPILVLIARLRTRRYGGQVRVLQGNFWKADWPVADGIFVFLTERYMSRLNKKLSGLKRPVRMVSYGFTIPGRKPVKRSGAFFLYRY